MSDIHEIEEDSTIAEVDRRLNKIASSEEPRTYLGMSEIGDKCYRKLWFAYHDRTTEKHEARALRIFKAGHRIEADIIRDLRLAGFDVTADQMEFKDIKVAGEFAFRGHCDGIIKGMVESKEPHILEIKSCSDKNFKLFIKHGIEEHPIYGEKYKAQAQTYMGYSGIKRCLFIVENKNTSERKQFRLKYKAKEFKAIKAKAKRIIEAEYPPPGINDSPTWFECKFCQYNNSEYCRRDHEVKLNWDK